MDTLESHRSTHSMRFHRAVGHRGHDMRVQRMTLIVWDDMNDANECSVPVKEGGKVAGTVIRQRVAVAARSATQQRPCSAMPITCAFLFRPQPGSPLSPSSSPSSTPVARALLPISLSRPVLTLPSPPLASPRRPVHRPRPSPRLLLSCLAASRTLNSRRLMLQLLFLLDLANEEEEGEDAAPALPPSR
ncbi:hypothetical protein Mp_6g06220 [Marchantia polymorpha subsp. ruderalis]|uniref:Uncharacterized protein n=2 Tax=Marchantia polymorpha TaxID=3197 RepID=A0AAF6BP44_MARPO|nr:hypothetical protein MARPO_0097s0022 [Marchantia polymorpha]BBN13778.1 hypothetical protein Mp_6g06220 [Marchantia polymorpha subsp. ruderalis]|eukprot:PTQ32536.1 hypothetical protein MARPO_0097s0022 [Marchantia polymorpha]